MSAPQKQVTITQGGPTEAIPAVYPAESSAILNMIERAARDTSVDVDKLRQLMEMRQQVEAKTAEREFDVAMTAVQTGMRPIAADSHNPQTKSRYASYPALDRAMRPIYTKHGFGLSFNTADGAPPDCVRVVCDVSHNGGHKRRYQIDMPTDGKGAKGGDVMTKTHATGSAASYGQRYLLKMIFNISVGDDDGNAAGDTGEVISQEQVDKMRSLIVERAANLAAFLKWARVERLEDIKAIYFNSCIEAIKRTGK